MRTPEIYRRAPSRGDHISSGSTKWTAVSERCLTWKQYGDVFYLYDERSNQTHFVNQLSADILSYLQSAALTSDELYFTILDQFEIEADEILRDALATTLTVLDHLGLIRSA